jgi:competence protein ComEC
LKIKRPLVCFFVAYSFGIITYSLNTKLIHIISILLFIGTTCFLYKERKKYKLSNFLFLLFIPVLFFIGNYLFKEQMKPYYLDEIFDSKINCLVEGRIEKIEDREDYQILILKKNTVSINNMEYNCKRIKVTTSSNLKFKIGNTILVKGQLIKFQKASNPGQFDEFQYNKIRKIEYKMKEKGISIINSDYSNYHNYLYSLKKKLIYVYETILPQREANILSAMILGESYLLDEDIKVLYGQSGISHILAISGLHVSLLGTALYGLLSKTKLPTYLITFLSVFLIISYGILTNFSVSTNRSVVMLICLLIGKLIGRTYDVLTATSLSALIILIQSPLEILNAGFLLSFGAILAIALLVPMFRSLCNLKTKLLDGFIVSVSIQIVTMPIILYYFYEIPIYGIFVNLLILPLSSILILLGLISGLLGIVLVPFSEFIVGGAYIVLKIYDEICNFSVSLPYANILVGKPNNEVIISYYVVLIVFLLFNMKKVHKKSLLLLFCLSILFIKPKEKLSVTFLDVGQGDSIFIRSQTNTTYLIDGGSSSVTNIGKYRIKPFLKSNGVWELDYVFLTHLDADHISGIQELITDMEDKSDIRDDGYYKGKIQIKNLILPNTNLIDKAYEDIVSLALSKGINVLRVQEGDVIKDGDTIITCLHPRSTYITSSRNAYSAVLSVTYKEFDLLLTGDLEEDGENIVLNRLKDKSDDLNLANIKLNGYDFLKVAHHGSKYSTKEPFLNYISPKISIISCGKDNTYGHPHVELMERLEAINSRVIITSEVGAITVMTDGKYYKILGYLD